MNVYESSRALSEYLVFHYGPAHLCRPFPFAPKDVEGFPVRTVRHLLGEPMTQPKGLAYDLGCAVGRSAFELSHYAAQVQAFDLSATFINAANQLLVRGRLETSIAIEGERTEQLVVHAPGRDPRASMEFKVGDALELAAVLPPADIVHAANLLCRLSAPARLLQLLHRLVRPDGILTLTTPFTWLEEFTPRSAWPRDGDGNAVSGRAWLSTILEPAFTLEYVEDMPFLIREHARKFQWGVALGMRWRRNGSGFEPSQ